MLADQTTYLPDDLLAKTDRASMAVSLEVRVPLIDQRVVEFAWRLPRALKTDDGQSKWILRQVLYRRSAERARRSTEDGVLSAGGELARGPLKGWAEDLLFDAKLNASGELRVPDNPKAMG